MSNKKKGPKTDMQKKLEEIGFKLSSALKKENFTKKISKKKKIKKYRLNKSEIIRIKNLRLKIDNFCL